jgi:hypothetical protein
LIRENRPLNQLVFNCNIVQRPVGLMVYFPLSMSQVYRIDHYYVIVTVKIIKLN